MTFTDMAEDIKNTGNADAPAQKNGSGTDFDDNDLALRAMSGDTQAFSSLAARYTGQLRLYIQSICPNPTDAEDICQESLRKAYQRISSFNPEYLFRSWLFSIAHNTSIDHIRRSSTFSTVKLGEADEPAVESHLLHDLSYQDIADETGLPLNTVRTRIRRAKLLLEEMMHR